MTADSKNPVLNNKINNIKGLFYFLIAITAISSLAFIAAGIALVILGASGDTSLEIFGNKISSENVGVVSIFLGCVTLISLFRRFIKSIEKILKVEEVRDDKSKDL